MKFSQEEHLILLFSQVVNKHEIGDVVILNADTNTVETPFDDLNSLPTEVVSESSN